MVLSLERNLTELLGLLPEAVLLVDAVGKLVYLNPAAQRVVGRTPMWSLAGGTLSMRRKAEDRELREALARLSPARPRATIVLRSREGTPVAIADLHRLASGVVAVRLSDPARRPAPSIARLRHIFGLTLAEARVAAGLLSGLGITAFATLHGVEPETVRSQVKRVRSKTGAHSQNEVLGILAATGADFVADETTKPAVQKG